MKTGTEALSARLMSEPLPESLILPGGEAWPQSRSDVIKHPQLELLGTRRGAPIERRLDAIVAEARKRDVPDVTILLIAEALNVAKYPDYIVGRLRALADSLVVVFFARHQVAALPSIVAHRVQSWTSPHHLEMNQATIVREANRRFYYDRYVDRWSGDNHELVALPYFEDDRKTDGLMARFTKYIGISVPPTSGSDAKNASLGAEQLTRLGALKKRLEWMRALPGLGSLAPLIFFAVRKRVQRESAGVRWKQTAVERKEIVAMYAESNARFKKLLGGVARRADWKRWFDTLSVSRTQ